MTIEEFLSVPVAEWVDRLRAAGFVSPVDQIVDMVAVMAGPAALVTSCGLCGLRAIVQDGEQEQWYAQHLKHCLAKAGRDALLARIRELEAGLRHAQYIAQEISTIAEHSEASGVDDGRNHPLSIAERLREIVELVNSEIIDGPSPITAALAGDRAG